MFTSSPLYCYIGTCLQYPVTDFSPCFLTICPTSSVWIFNLNLLLVVKTSRLKKKKNFLPLLIPSVKLPPTFSFHVYKIRIIISVFFTRSLYKLNKIINIKGLTHYKWINKELLLILENIIISDRPLILG